MFVTYDVDLQLKQNFFQLQYIVIIIHSYSYNTFNIKLNTSATCVHIPQVHSTGLMGEAMREHHWFSQITPYALGLFSVFLGNISYSLPICKRESTDLLTS